MLEEIKEQTRQHPKMLAVFLLCFCLGLTTQGIGWAMVRSAQASVREAEMSVLEVSKQFDELDVRFKAAVQVHRAEYLKSFETASLKQALASANGNLVGVKSVRDPGRMKQVAGEVRAAVLPLSAAIRERNDYLELLDRSRREFFVLVGKLDVQVAGHGQLVATFLEQGYFQKHFQNYFLRFYPYQNLLL